MWIVYVCECDEIYHTFHRTDPPNLSTHLHEAEDPLPRQLRHDLPLHRVGLVLLRRQQRRQTLRRRRRAPRVQGQRGAGAPDVLEQVALLQHDGAPDGEPARGLELPDEGEELPLPRGVPAGAEGQAEDISVVGGWVGEWVWFVDRCGGGVQSFKATGLSCLLSTYDAGR